MKYRLDPDFRLGNKIGITALVAVPRCIRCQKEIADVQNKFPMTVEWNNHYFVDGHDLKAFPEQSDRAAIECGFMGPDCHKRQTKFVVLDNQKQ